MEEDPLLTANKNLDVSLDAADKKSVLNNGVHTGTAQQQGQVEPSPTDAQQQEVFAPGCQFVSLLVKVVPPAPMQRQEGQVFAPGPIVSLNKVIPLATVVNDQKMTDAAVLTPNPMLALSSSMPAATRNPMLFTSSPMLATKSSSMFAIADPMPATSNPMPAKPITTMAAPPIPSLQSTKMVIGVMI